MNDLFSSQQIQGMVFIFFARIVDVSLGTFRIVLVSRGYRYLAPLIGFVEIFIWISVIATAIKTLNNVTGYFVYALGFATGNYVGMLLESKIAIGYQSIRVVTSKMVSALPLVLREEGFGITTVTGKGMRGDVDIIYTMVPRRDVKRVVDIVKVLEPHAFSTIEDVKSHHRGFIRDHSILDVFSRSASKKS